MGWKKWRFLDCLSSVQHRLRGARRSSRPAVRAECGGGAGRRSSPPSAARLPLRRRQVGAVIYVSLVVRALKRKKRPETCLGRFRPRGIFRPQARGVGERRRAARPGAARSWRLSAPLVTPAPERIKPGAPCFREPVGGLTSASAARPAVSASGLSSRINVAPRRINSKN